MIAGTVRNSVKMAVMQNQWQQKKSDGCFAGQDKNKEINKEMTAAERELTMFQQQAYDIQQNREKDNIQAELEAKIQSGHELTSDEIEYLRRNNPQALKEYEELRQEKKAYREALEHCKSKEEAEQLKLSKMGSFMSQAKEIANNPHIPKQKKKELIEKLMKLTDVVATEHARFASTPHYQELPDKEWDKDSESEDIRVENAQRDGKTQNIDNEFDTDKTGTDKTDMDKPDTDRAVGKTDAAQGEDSDGKSKDAEDLRKSRHSNETDSMRGEFAGILVDIKL